MKVEVGMWVRRRKDSKSLHWTKCCCLAGINPEAPIKIDRLVGGDPVFLPINMGSWWAICFEPAAPPDRPLEDYL